MKVLGYLRSSAWDKLDAVQYYRTYLPLRELNDHLTDEHEVTCAAPDVLEGATDEYLSGRDIYTMARLYKAESCREYLDAAHKAGGQVVLDTDDDMTETYRLVSGHGQEFIEVVSMIDYLAVSTEPLAELLGQYTKRPPVVLKNCVDSAWMQKVASKSRRIVDEDQITLGLSGSPTHWGDWYKPSIPLARIGRDYPDVTTIVHGEAPRYMYHLSAGSTVVQLGTVPFSIYPVLLSQFDILLCAVDKTDSFNDGKSCLKALECMALGVVPICSRFQPYLDLKTAGAPIVVIDEDSREGWYEAMQDLLDRPDDRKYLSSQGPAWVLANRDMCNTGWKQWEAFYSKIVEDNAVSV